MIRVVRGTEHYVDVFSALFPTAIYNTDSLPVYAPHLWEDADQAPEYFRAMLYAAASGGGEALEAYVNCHHPALILLSPLRRQRNPTTRPEAGVSIPALVVSGPRQLAAAIMAVALTTPTGNGDTLADRISQCEGCREFFISKYRRPSRYCGKACRNGGRTKKARG